MARACKYEYSKPASACESATRAGSNRNEKTRDNHDKRGLVTEQNRIRLRISLLMRPPWRAAVVEINK